MDPGPVQMASSLTETFYDLNTSTIHPVYPQPTYPTPGPQPPPPHPALPHPPPWLQRVEGYGVVGGGEMGFHLPGSSSRHAGHEDVVGVGGGGGGGGAAVVSSSSSVSTAAVVVAGVGGGAEERLVRSQGEDTPVTGQLLFLSVSAYVVSRLCPEKPRHGNIIIIIIVIIIIVMMMMMMMMIVLLLLL